MDRGVLDSLPKSLDLDHSSILADSICSFTKGRGSKLVSGPCGGAAMSVVVGWRGGLNAFQSLFGCVNGIDIQQVDSDSD